MKKVKIMLSSIAIVALLGGALAFKAKFNTTYCTAEVGSGTPAGCPNLLENSTTNIGGTEFWTAAPRIEGTEEVCTYLSANQTPQPLTCVAKTKLIHE